MKQLYDLTDNKPIPQIVVQPKLDPNGGLVENEQGLGVKVGDAFTVEGLPQNYTFGNKPVFKGRKTFSGQTIGNMRDIGTLVASKYYIIGYNVVINDNNTNLFPVPYYDLNGGLAMCVIRPNTNVFTIWGSGGFISDKTWDIQVEFEYVER